MTAYFAYGRKEVDYLKSRDKKLGDIIDNIGHIYRAVDTDLFSSVVRQIVGQQISMKAQATIWNRLLSGLGDVNAGTILAVGPDWIQSCGTTNRKAAYIYEFAQKVESGEFDLDGIWQKPDEEVIKELSSLRGIGTWTAEMLMLFCMQRPDILSYDDLAIQRGMRMVYRHRKIDRRQFEVCRRRYSPYGSVASLYLWAVACGEVPGITDPGAKKPASAAKKAGKQTPHDKKGESHNV